MEQAQKILRDIQEKPPYRRTRTWRMIWLILALLLAVIGIATAVLSRWYSMFLPFIGFPCVFAVITFVRWWRSCKWAEMILELREILEERDRKLAAIDERQNDGAGTKSLH